MGEWPLSSRPGWGSRPFSDPDHPLTPKGAIGWSESIPGLKQPGRDESGAEGSHNRRRMQEVGGVFTPGCC
jgi:hypothetical protein